jgi:hypothetical protein
LNFRPKKTLKDLFTMTTISNFGSPRLRTTMGAALMLSLLVGGGTACADKTSGTLLGAGLGAVGGAAIGYAAGGSDGALIGAAAGAVVGGIAGYALSGKKETVRKEESVVRQEVAATTPAAPRQNIVEVRDVGVWPSRVAPRSDDQPQHRDARRRRWIDAALPAQSRRRHLSGREADP